MSGSMRDGQAVVPAARNEDEFEIATVGDETVLFDRERYEYHALQHGADAVWRLCDGVRTRDELVEALGWEPERVDAAVDALAGAGLLTIDRDAWDGRMGRRGMLKLAAGGLLGSAVLPAVASITAPQPASAASPPCAMPGESCDATLPCCPAAGSINIVCRPLFEGGAICDLA